MYEEDIERWKAESNIKVIDPDYDDQTIALRREKLMEAKFHAHRAVEVYFRGLVISAEALWGEIEIKKAA